MLSSRPKVLISWSTGKDSAWMLHLLRCQNEVDVAGLLTTVNQTHGRVAMHGVRSELLEAQAKAAGVPVWRVPIPYPCRNEAYDTAMKVALARARDQGVTHLACGDLFLEDIKLYRDRLLADTGIEPLYPLWKLPTRPLAHAMIDGGLRAKIVCLDPRRLGANFLGRDFDRDLLADLPDDVDPCGENGEFHTFTYAGPMLAAPLEVEVGAVVQRDGFLFVDVLPKTLGAVHAST